jgi:cation diffusion facilitator CzcD-associated flavoprotein CzcO
MQIKFSQLPSGIQQQYHLKKNIVKVEVFDAAGSLGPEWYRLSFSNGSTHEYRYQHLSNGTTATGWVKSN